MEPAAPTSTTWQRIVRVVEPHQGGRFAALDGYRAVAAIGVLVYHVAGNAKLTQGTASFIEYGWTASPDAWGSLNGLFRTWDRSGLGSFNAGRYSNPALDAVIDAIRVEPDLAKRRAMVGQALKMVAEDLPYLPLYRRKLNWAMAREVDVVPWPNDTIELRWARRR